jgi:membrane protein DedA with SNARE-associated domain
MHEIIQFLDKHGYTVLFGSVFAEQMGLPVPAFPMLLAMGALAGEGRFSLALAVVVALGASLIADSFWYQLGRRRGPSVLKLLCRISLEPDSCVRRAEDTFSRRGAAALLFGKFIPGVSVMSTPMAGVVGLSFGWFLLCDGLGAALWSGTIMSTGYLARHQLERVAEGLSMLGGRLLLLLVTSLAAYIAWKFNERRRFLRQLRIARITPEEVMAKMQAGEEIVVVDLRHSIEIDGDAVKVQGAIHLLPEDLDEQNEKIPRDREVILYCT